MKDYSRLPVGTEFGHWTTVGSPYRKGTRWHVKVSCKCGYTDPRRIYDLETGRTTQCAKCSYADRDPKDAWSINPKNSILGKGQDNG